MYLSTITGQRAKAVSQRVVNMIPWNYSGWKHHLSYASCELRRLIYATWCSGSGLVAEEKT